MKDSRGIIHTYNTIYYVDLVIINQYVDLEEIQELFCYTDGNNIDEDIMRCDANVTYGCKRKIDNMDVIIVKYNKPCGIKGVNKTLDFVNTVSHEATHVAMRIYQHMGQDICQCSPEPFCYLVGWVAECIYKSIKNIQ